MTKVTYNFFLSCAQVGRGAAYFVPALEQIQSRFSLFSLRNRTTMSLMFLTDGQPSDNQGSGRGSVLEKILSNTAILPLCVEIAEVLGPKLVATFLGFGDEDMSVCNAMAEEFSRYSVAANFSQSVSSAYSASGASNKSSGVSSSISSKSLSASLKNHVKSSASSKLSFSNLANRGSPSSANKSLKLMRREEDESVDQLYNRSNKEDWVYFDLEKDVVSWPALKGILDSFRGGKDAALRSNPKLGICTKLFGVGAEVRKKKHANALFIISPFVHYEFSFTFTIPNCSPTISSSSSSSSFSSSSSSSSSSSFSFFFFFFSPRERATTWRSFTRTMNFLTTTRQNICEWKTRKGRACGGK